MVKNVGEALKNVGEGLQPIRSQRDARRWIPGAKRQYMLEMMADVRLVAYTARWIRSTTTGIINLLQQWKQLVILCGIHSRREQIDNNRKINLPQPWTQLVIYHSSGSSF